MHVSIDMMSYTIPPEQRGYYELSSAIVSTAVRDYRMYKKVNSLREMELIRKFFLSEVFENISGVDNPNVFLQRLDEEIEKELRSGVRRKRDKQAMKCNG